MPGSKITRKPIRDLNFPKSAVLGGAVRKGKTLITMGVFKAEPHDKLIVFCLPGSVKKVEAFFK